MDSCQDQIEDVVYTTVAEQISLAVSRQCLHFFDESAVNGISRTVADMLVDYWYLMQLGVR